MLDGKEVHFKYYLLTTITLGKHLTWGDLINPGCAIYVLGASRFPSSELLC
jgi:hypothetical protein